MMGSVAQTTYTPMHSSADLWTPFNVTSLITESSGLVSRVDNYAGNGNYLEQASSSAQPETGTRTVNGRNVLDFDGADDLEFSSAMLTLPEDDATVVVVIHSDTDPAEARIVNFQRSGSRYLLRQRSDTGGYLMSHNATLSSVSTTATTTNLNIIYAAKEGTTQKIKINGGSEATDSGGANDTAASTVGYIGSANGAVGFDGVICELVVWLTAVSDATRDKEIARLNAKWGAF